METVSITSNNTESLVKFKYDQTIVNILKEFKNRIFLQDMRIFSLPNKDIELFKSKLSENNITWKEEKDTFNETIYYYKHPNNFEVQLPIRNKEFYKKIKLDHKIVDNLLKFDSDFFQKFIQYSKEYNIDLVEKKNKKILKDITTENFNILNCILDK